MDKTGMFLLAALLAGSVAAGEVDLRALIADAAKSRQAVLKVPPGVYRLGKDPADDKAHLVLNRIHDLEIDGTGAELVFTRIQGTNGIVIRDCENLTLKGFSIDLDPISFTQGTVAAVAPDYSYYDVRIDPGYETDPAAFRNRFRPMSIFDPATRLWKPGVEDLFLEQVEVPEPGLWRVRVRPGNRRKYNVTVGDKAAIPGVAGCAVTAAGSTNLVYDGITIYQAGTMAFHEHGGGGNTRIVNCKVTRRPGTDRLLSSNADAFHCKNMRKGPTVENCVFEYMQDDGINIHGMLGWVKGDMEETKLTLLPRYESGILAGDTLEFFDPATHRSKGRAAVTEVTNLPNMSPAELKRYGTLSGIVKSVTLASPVRLSDGDRYINHSASGSGFAIRNNRFGPLRYRGMLIRTSNGAIENNTVRDTGNGGIYFESSFGPESEGPYAENIRVENNILLDIGAFPGWDKGVGIQVIDFNYPKPQTADLAQNHRNLRISGNRISGTSNSGIRVMNGRDIVITGNLLERIGSRNCTEKLNVKPVEVLHSSNVEVN